MKQSATRILVPEVTLPRVVPSVNFEVPEASVASEITTGCDATLTPCIVTGPERCTPAQSRTQFHLTNALTRAKVAGKTHAS